MQFRVVLPLKARDKSCDPAEPNPVNGVCARRTPLVRLTDGKGHLAPGVKIDKIRQFVLIPTDDGDFVNNTKWNGLLSPNIYRDFPYDGVSELPRVGSTELWEFINVEQGGPGHPMHTHLAQFQILNRQQIDANGYQAAYDAAFGGPGSAPLPPFCTKGVFCPDYGPPLDYLTPNDDGALGGNPAVSEFIDPLKDPIIPPAPGESGWKDVAVAFGGQVLRIVVRWTPTDIRVIPNKSSAGLNLYNFDPKNGYYVWHCHFLGHEDNEVMRPYKVAR